MSAIGAPVAMSYGGVKGVARMTRGPDAMIARKTMEKRALVAMLTAAHARRLDKNGGAVGIFSPRTQNKPARYQQCRQRNQVSLPFPRVSFNPNACFNPLPFLSPFPFPFLSPFPFPFLSPFPPSEQACSPPAVQAAQPGVLLPFPPPLSTLPTLLPSPPFSPLHSYPQNKPARYQQFRQRNQVSTQMATRVADVMVRAVRKDKAAVNIEDLAKYDPSGTLPMLVAYSHPLCSKSECFECRTFLHLLYLPLLYLPLSSISGALPTRVSAAIPDPPSHSESGAARVANINDEREYDPSGTLPMLVAYSHPLCSKSE
ncbi:unnamed protein product [Closterium sp. NIES-64]|nr:unnamed protein product [Closterium sp. NIES-64]